MMREAEKKPIDTNYQTEFTLDDAKVKLIFAPQKNEEAIQNAKDILLKSMLRRTASPIAKN